MPGSTRLLLKHEIIPSTAKDPSSWPVIEPTSHPLNPYHSLGCLAPLQMLKERKQLSVTFNMCNFNLLESILKIKLTLHMDKLSWKFVVKGIDLVVSF